jgi:hypothetical protein
VPFGISAVLMQTLSLNPEDRPHDAPALRAALDQARFATPSAPGDWAPAAARHAPPDRAVAAAPAAAATIDVVSEPQVPSEPARRLAQAAPPPQSLPAPQSPDPAADLILDPSDPTLAAPDLHSLSRSAAHRRSGRPRRLLARLRGDRRLLLAAPVLLVVLLFAVFAQQPSTPDAPAASVATPAPRRSAVPTVAAAAAVVRTPSSPAATATVEPTPAPTEVINLLLPEAGAIEPTDAYTASFPLTFTVRGANLDQGRSFTFVSADGMVVTPAVVAVAPGAVLLELAALPAPLNGAKPLTLHIDERAQRSVSIMLRDYREQLTVEGVLGEYRWSNRIQNDDAGAYTTLMPQPDLNGEPVGVLRNGQRVDILRDDLAGWYLVRISGNGEVALAGAVGWVERWLVENRNLPLQQLAFAAVIGQTPTDAAVQCGTQFNSSIYGSVEDGRGRGIAGATVQVVSADGRNRYSVRTGRGGTYTVGGLGCTTWVVRLVRVPLDGQFSPTGVTVRNLNGGQYTAAEVRFRQR